MKSLYAALYCELLKIRRSRVFLISLVFFVFISLMMGLLMLIAKHPELAENSAILSTKASLIGTADWPSYFDLLMQLGLVLGVIGPGIVTIWVFGREYSDRVIKDILAMPVSRFYIICSKLIVVFFWSFLLLTLMFLTGIFAGLLTGLDKWDTALLIKNLIVYSESSLLTILLITPVALITCVSRGYLLPVGFLILIMIITQFLFVGLEGLAPYFPWAIPALITGVAGADTPAAVIVSYIIMGAASLAGFLGTAAWWRYADHH
jgi:ABC-2 type transport system permease protein